MPYVVVKDTSVCPSARPWAVKNEDTGKLFGCHPSKEAARKQQDALYVNVPEATRAPRRPGRDEGE